MRYLLLCLIILTGCHNVEYPRTEERISNGIVKTQDGNITCYTVYQSGISCVVTDGPASCQSKPPGEK